MSISNLTNTKWKFNPTVDIFAGATPLGTVALSFTSNGTNYTSLTANVILQGEPPAPVYGVLFDSTFMGISSVQKRYREILITGGSDVTTTRVIDWISANAVQKFDVTFVTNGGEAVSGLSFIDALPAILPTTTKRNYAFDGWCYDVGLTNAAQGEDVITANITLYAKWVFIGYEISFVTNGGTEIEKLVAQFDIPDSLPTPIKTNSLLVSWCYNEELSQRANSGNVLSDNITLYAKWYDSLGEFYKDLADAVRSKTGNVNPIKHVNIPDEVNSIEVRRPEKSPSIALDFTDGDVTLTPQAGNVYSQVTLLKDETHIPENIKRGVVLYGIEGELDATMPVITSSADIFVGATIPLTRKDNPREKENNYTYKSETYNITITGLNGRATITGNGTKNVVVAFDVTTGTTSLKNFTITCVKGAETLTYTGLHAHYGVVTTNWLTFVYKNKMPDGSEGDYVTNYGFIDSMDAPVFHTNTGMYNGIYAYQILSVLIKNGITALPAKFLANCNSFNQPLDLSSVTEIRDTFLNNCYSFNQPLDLPNVTSISFYSMGSCYAFNQPISLPNITSIGDGFLSGSYSFNQPMSLPNITYIGNTFMSSCYSFNQPISLPSVTIINNDFLSGCYSFNQPLDLPSVESIKDKFLSDCRAFNQPLDLPNITSIGNSFMGSCYSFGQPLDLPNITSIGTTFLSGCYSFNQPLDLPNVTSVGASFLSNCYSFDQPLSFPNVTSIGNSFMGSCYAFRQPLDLSNVTSIGNSFMGSCYSFDQPLSFPNVTSIGTTFMYGCMSLSQITWNISLYPTDNNSLAQNVNSKTATGGDGIKVYGTKRAELMAALANRTSSPFRKLIDGGY